MRENKKISEQYLGFSNEDILCFSGGKDSSVILHKLLVAGWRGKIVHGDTTLELPEHYSWLAWFEKEFDIKIQVEKAPYDIDTWLYGTFTKGKKEGEVRGLPLGFGNGCHIRGTFKVRPIQRYIVKTSKASKRVILLGFGSNEIERSKQKIYHKGFRFPLIEWSMSEEDCIDYLVKQKLPFPFLHKDRTGCYLCPQQSKYSLWQLWRDYPKLWEKTKHYDNIIEGGYRGFKGCDKGLDELEVTFKQGHIPKKRMSNCFSCKAALLSFESPEFKENEDKMVNDELNEVFDFTEEEKRWCHMHRIFRHEDKIFFVRVKRKSNEFIVKKGKKIKRLNFF